MDQAFAKSSHRPHGRLTSGRDHHDMRSMLVLRSILIALGGLLAVLLISRGFVILGVVLGAMAVVRVAMLLSMHRRRAARARLIARRRARFGPNAS